MTNNERTALVRSMTPVVIAALVAAVVLAALGYDIVGAIVAPAAAIAFKVAAQQLERRGNTAGAVLQGQRRPTPPDYPAAVDTDHPSIRKGSTILRKDDDT